MLKADLHIHTKGDPVDYFLKYTPQDLIKLAAKKKFDVLSFSWHHKVFDTKPLKSYAKKYGITLLPGTELSIEKKHTLVYNISQEEASRVKSLEDLYDLRDHALIGAPHPFFVVPSCLGNTVFEHPKLFDFIEHSHFYTKTINLNKKAALAAQQLKVPLVANSDIHSLSWFGKEYTMIDAPPSVDGIIDAIKKKATGKNLKRVQPFSTPHPLSTFLKTTTLFAPKAAYYFLFQEGKKEKNSKSYPIQREF